MRLAAGCAMLCIILSASSLAGQTPANSPSSEPQTSNPDSGKEKSDPTSSLERAKHPFNWLAFNADFRLREEYYNNVVTLNSNLPNHEHNYQRYRARFGVVVRPFKVLDIGVRLMTERRSYLKPDSMEGFKPDEVLFDNLYITWRDIFN